MIRQNKKLKKKLFSFFNKRIMFILSKFMRISFKEAKTQKDIRKVFRVRYEIYVDEGYISKNNTGEFTDKYDFKATSFLATKNNKPVGTVRIIFNSKIGFPTENLFNFKPPSIPRDNLAEVSRLAIKQPFRTESKLIMLGLMNTIYKHAKENYIHYLYFNMPQKLANYFQEYGISFQELKEKPPQERHIKERELIGGYFAQKRLRPYILNLKQNIKDLGL